MDWNWKTAATVFGTVAAALSILGSWIALDFPLMATRGWVHDQLRPIVYQQLISRRHINDLDLYQWQVSNPSPTGPALDTINRLKADIERLDKQIAAMNDP